MGARAILNQRRMQRRSHTKKGYPQNTRTQKPCPPKKNKKQNHKTTKKKKKKPNKNKTKTKPKKKPKKPLISINFFKNVREIENLLKYFRIYIF
jgi:cell division septation protein DedD